MRSLRHLRFLGWFLRLAMPPAWRRAFGRSRAGDLADKLLSKTLPAGLHLITVPTGINKGLRLSVDLRKEKIYYWGLHEPELQELLPRIVEPGQVVYDVGAYIGFVTAALARLVGPAGRVFAFEPIPEQADRIQAAAQMNGLTQITVIPKAVSDRQGDVAIREAGFASHMSDEVGIMTGKFPSITLDAFVYEEGFPPPKLVKVDIEGAEILALTGMLRLVREHKPILVIEVHPGRAESVWNWLSAHDYEVQCYTHGGWRRVKDVGSFGDRCLTVCR